MYCAISLTRSCIAVAVVDDPGCRYRICGCVLPAVGTITVFSTINGIISSSLNSAFCILITSLAYSANEESTLIVVDRSSSPITTVFAGTLIGPISLYKPVATWIFFNPVNFSA